MDPANCIILDTNKRLSAFYFHMRVYALHLQRKNGQIF